MKMIIKRIFSGVLLTAMIFSITSCSQADDMSSESTEKAQMSDIETEAGADILDTIGDHNFDGATFTILCQHTEERPNVAPDEETGDIFYDSVYQRDRTVEERYSVEIQYEQDANRANIKSNLTKSVNSQEDIYDIVITCLSDGFNTLAPDGQLMDLRSIDSLSLDDVWWNQSMNDAMTFNDKQFVAAGPISLSYFHSAFLTLVNLNMAKDYNISTDDLYTAVREGKWTLDKLETLMTDIYADLNNNGKADVEDRFGFALCDSSGNALYTGSGLEMATNTGDSIQLNMVTERSLTVLDRIHTLCMSADVMKTERLGSDSSGVSYKIALFEKGNLLFSLNGVNNVVTYLRDMENDYGILPIPKWDASQSEYYTLYNPWMPSGFGVPVTCGNTELVGVISEALARTGYTIVQPNLVEVTMKEKATRDENSKEMLNIIIDAMTVDLNAIFDFGTSSTLLREYAVAQKDQFISPYEKKAKLIQKEVDKLIEQYERIS